MLVCTGPWLQSPVGVYVQTQIYTNAVHFTSRLLRGIRNQGDTSVLKFLP